MYFSWAGRIRRAQGEKIRDATQSPTEKESPLGRPRQSRVYRVGCGVVDNSSRYYFYPISFIQMKNLTSICSLRLPKIKSNRRFSNYLDKIYFKK